MNCIGESKTVEFKTSFQKEVIEVDEYPIKPVSYKGRYYTKRTNSNHQMSDAHMKTVNSNWDYFIDPYHGLDEQNIKKFMKMSNIDDDIATVYSKDSLSIHGGLINQETNEYFISHSNENWINTALYDARHKGIVLYEQK